MKLLHIVSFVLLVVGGLNWGLVALLDFNLVNTVFGASPMLEKFVYVAVGVSAVYVLVTHMQECKICKGKK